MEVKIIIIKTLLKSIKNYKESTSSPSFKENNYYYYDYYKKSYNSDKE